MSDFMNWIAPLIGLLGVFIGAGLQYSVSKSQERVRNTFALHREFHSPEMLSKRVEAELILLPIDEVKLKDLANTVTPVAMASVWDVVEFYARLETTLRYKQAHRRIAADLFGQNYTYWYESHLKGSLEGSGWEEQSRLDHLALLFQRTVNRKRYNDWIRHAANEATNLRAKITSP